MEYNLMVFVGSFMGIFVLDRMVRVFFDKRRTTFPVFALSFLFYVVLINVSSLLAIPRGSLLVWFASLIVVSLNYEGSWIKRIIATISLMAVAVTMEMAVMLLSGIYFDHFFDGDTLHNALTMTVSFMVQFMAALALQRLKHLKKDLISSPTILALLFVIPLSSAVLLYFLAVTTDPTPFGAVLTSAIIFGINVIVFYLHDRLSATHARNLETALHEREKEYYLAQCRLMQESVGQMKGIQHDMKNHLAAIKSCVLKDRSGEATDYIDGLLDGMGNAGVHSDTGNAAFDGIVNYKLRDAKRLGITTDLNLLISPNTSIEASDLAVILGNLLDNALEAMTGDREKRIRLDVEQARGTLLIYVENTFDGEVRYAGGHGKARLPLTRKPSGDHGHGLRNVQRVTEKYDGHMDITHDGETFSATVLLYENRGFGQNAVTYR